MDDLLPILAPPALVFGLLLLLRGSLIVGCLLTLLSVCCFGYEFVHFDAGPLPLTVDRILLGLVIAMYVWQRGLGRTDPKPLNRADICLLAFTGYLLVSMLLSDWQGFPKGQVGPMWRWIGGYFTPLVLYWCAKQAVWDRRTARLVQASFALFGIYLGVTAILEITKQWSLVFPSYIADPKVGLHFGRARGPMVHGVSFGHWIGVCLLAAWVWGCGAQKWGKVAVGFLLPLYSAGVFFSYTRSVWMGTAAGLAIVGLLTLPSRARNIALGCGLMAGLVVGATMMDKIVGFEREQSAADTAESANMRVGFAYVSWLMFQDRPIFGFGFGRFPLDKLPYLDDRSTDLFLDKLRPYVHHNTFLSILTDTGLVGLALFLAMMAYWGVNAWRIIRDADTPCWAKHQAIWLLGAIGVYAPQLLFHELSYTPLDNSLVYFLAGTVSALVPQQLAPQQQAQANRAATISPAAPQPQTLAPAQ